MNFRRGWVRCVSAHYYWYYMDKQLLCRKIVQLVAPITNFHGAELVRVKIIGAMSRPTIQIMAERPNATMDLQLCETLSREYSLLLDVEDVVQSEYTLEVSSPGIDRPLTRLKDFQRWYGFEVVVELREKYQSRRRVKGLLQAPKLLEENQNQDFMLIIHEESGIFEVPFSMVADAQLTLSDELLEATKNGKRLHGFAYDDADSDALSNVELEIDSQDNVKEIAPSQKPKKIEEIEEAVMLNNEGK